MFKLEKHMTPIVKNWMVSKGYWVKKESWLGGRCDLVGCLPDEKKTSHRNNKDNKKLTPLRWDHLHLLSLLQSKNGYDEADLLVKLLPLYLNAEMWLEQIEWLAKRKYIEKVGSAYTSKVGSWFPFYKEIIGVELKLTDIKGVIKQAVSNQYHCDYSYVAMPNDYKLIYKLFDKLNQNDKALAQIGVIGVTKEGCTVLREPGRVKGYESKVSQIGEKFWRNRKEFI